MMSSKQKTQCSSIFKDNANKNTAFSKLWAEIINQSEQTKYGPFLENTSKTGYAGHVQSRFLPKSKN